MGSNTRAGYAVRETGVAGAHDPFRARSITRRRSLPYQLIRRPRRLVYRRRAVERRVPRVDQRQLHVRRQQAQRLGNVADAQHAEEVRPLLVRRRRINDHHLLDRRLEQGRIGGKDAGLAATDESDLFLIG